MPNIVRGILSAANLHHNPNAEPTQHTTQATQRPHVTVRWRFYVNFVHNRSCGAGRIM